jgi:hypothetical protein
MTRSRELAELASAYDSGGSMGFRNRIINGDMRIDQRNAGAGVTPTANAYTLDRWLANVSTASKFSVQQSTIAPAGFTNSTLITSTSAYTVSSGDYQTFQQRIEAFNMSDMGWGTSSAQAVTLSFWVRSSLTGTFGGSFYFPASTGRTYPFSYSISAANTWEQKTITVSGDTFSNTAPTGNSLYVIVQFALGVGSTFSGTANAWVTGNFASVTGATNLIATNGATMNITGVQLEAGSVATPFERRDYGRELIMCQRYYYRQVNYMGQSAPYNSESTGAKGTSNTGATVYRVSRPHPVQMRATPTVSYANIDVWDGVVQRAVSSIANNNSSIYVRSLDYNMSAAMGGNGLTASEFVQPSGFVDCSAEL